MIIFKLKKRVIVQNDKNGEYYLFRPLSDIIEDDINYYTLQNVHVSDAKEVFTFSGELGNITKESMEQDWNFFMISEIEFKSKLIGYSRLDNYPIFIMTDDEIRDAKIKSVINNWDWNLIGNDIHFRMIIPNGTQSFTTWVKEKYNTLTDLIYEKFR